MLTLASKLKRDDGLKGSRTSAAASDSTRRVSVRDRLLVKGNVACAVLTASQRGLARGFWDAKRPVAEQKYLFENSLTHNCSLLTTGGLRVCTGRGNARGDVQVCFRGRNAPCQCCPWPPRVAVGEQAPRAQACDRAQCWLAGGGLFRVSRPPQHRRLVR